MFALFQQFIRPVDVPLHITQLWGKLQRRDSHLEQPGA
jgi:hypothetical protein